MSELTNFVNKCLSKMDTFSDAVFENNAREYWLQRKEASSDYPSFEEAVAFAIGIQLIHKSDPKLEKKLKKRYDKLVKQVKKK